MTDSEIERLLGPLPKHVRPDGTVDDQVVETYYQEFTRAEIDGDALRIFSDGPGYDVETRIPIAALRKFLDEHAAPPPEARHES